MSSLPPPREDPRRFVVAMALRRALKLVRGLLRKPGSELDAHIIASKIVDEFHIAGWEIERKPSDYAGFISGDHDGP